MHDSLSSAPAIGALRSSYGSTNNLWRKLQSLGEQFRERFFCDIVVLSAAGVGKDISAVYEVAPGIAGNYGVSGCGIKLEEFFPYFGGRLGFVAHLEVCKAELTGICKTPESIEIMLNVIGWAQYLLSGGEIDSEFDFHKEKPPVIA